MGNCIKGKVELNLIKFNLKTHFSFFEILEVVTQVAQWLDKKMGILWQATIRRPEEAKFMGKEGNNDFLALSFSFNE